jgi:biopolymer transport protein ExbD
VSADSDNSIKRSSLWAQWPVLAVPLALIAAFFMGSLYPYHPKASSAEEEDIISLYPDVNVWVSKDKLFVWDKEPARPLGELSYRIQVYKAKHPLRFASISGDEETRYKEMVYVLSELKKSGFYSVTIETRTMPDPSLRQ